MWIPTSWPVGWQSDDVLEGQKIIMTTFERQEWFSCSYQGIDRRVHREVCIWHLECHDPECQTTKDCMLKDMFPEQHQALLQRK